MSPSRGVESMANRIRDVMEERETVESVCHLERTGTLESGAESWQEYDSLSALPDRPLAGWEELVVFTDQRVYRQVGVAYAGGVEVTPRTPAAVGAASRTAAAADHD